MQTRLRLKCVLRSARYRLAQMWRGSDPPFREGVLNAGASRRALLVHFVELFSDRPVDLRHQNRWQAHELARLLASRGYSVDVVRPGAVVPAGVRPYELVMDLHPGMTEYPRTDATLTIAYITGSNPAFSNHAEHLRLEALARRRGVRLRARRQVPKFRGGDLASCKAMFFLGSQANLETYSDLSLPPVKWIVNFAYPVPTIDRPQAGRGFLFLASGGQVHKGLDLLLEVAARRPEWILHVCSAFHEEPDFCRAYRKELFGLPNVLPHGFQRLDSPRFVQIAQACSHMVLPSCSEANAGSVLSAMAAGLIPLVSPECGFSVDEVRHLVDCSITTIDAAMAECMAEAPADVLQQSTRVRLLVEQRYSPAAFTASLAAALDDVLAGSR